MINHTKGEAAVSRWEKVRRLYRGSSPASASLAILGSAAWRVALRRSDQPTPRFERRVRLPGFTGHMRLFSSELTIYRQVIADGLYEFHPEAVVQPDWRVVEVGAHVGFYATSRAAMLDPERGGRLITFEADPGNYALLAKNTAPFPHVVAVPEAVFSEAGSVEFVSTARSHAGYIDGFGNVRADAPRPDGALVRVPATTLDDAVVDQQLDRIDLLKINAEGVEVEILDGGTDRALPITWRVLMSHESEAPFSVIRDKLEGFDLHPVAHDDLEHYLFVRT